MDNSSLDEVLHIPSILTVHGSCAQTYLFQDLLVYNLLMCLDCWSKNISLEIFFLCSDKELATIPSSAGSFCLVSCLSKH
jgi:hypothetical protein